MPEQLDQSRRRPVNRLLANRRTDSVDSSVGGSDSGVSMGTGMRWIQRKGGPFSGKRVPFSDKRRGTAQLYWDMLKEECEGINRQLDVTFCIAYGIFLLISASNANSQSASLLSAVPSLNSVGSLVGLSIRLISKALIRIVAHML